MSSLEVIKFCASVVADLESTADIRSAVDYIYLQPEYRENSGISPKHFQVLDDRVYDIYTPPDIVDALLGEQRKNIISLTLKSGRRYPYKQAWSMLTLLTLFQENVNFYHRLLKRQPISADHESLTRSLKYYFHMFHGPNVNFSHYTLEDFPYHLVELPEVSLDY